MEHSGQAGIREPGLPATTRAAATPAQAETLISGNNSCFSAR